MPAASTATIDEVFAWLQALDVDTLDLAGVQQAMRATRPLRGWLDVIDARLRTQYEQLLKAAADEIEASGGHGSGDGDGAGDGAGDGSGAGDGDGDGAGADLGTGTAGSSDQSGTAPIDLGPPLPINPFANPINHAGGVSTSEGRRRALRAQILRRFPGLEAALMSGRITTEHLDVIARALHGLSTEVDQCLDQHADEIVNATLELEPTPLRRRLLALITRITAQLGLTSTHRRIPPSTLRIWGDQTTGAGTMHASLTPGHYQRVSALIEAAGRSLAAGTDQRNLNRDELAAQALMFLLGIETDPGVTRSDSAGSGGGRSGRAGSGSRQSTSTSTSDRKAPPQVTAVINLLVDAETLFGRPHTGGVCEYADGTPIDLDELRRIACTSPIVPIVVSGGTLPLNVGRQHRLATNAQHRALEAIYSTCAIPGCSVVVTRCEMHHIDYYERGGCTDLNNLVPLCSNHHHRLHEQHWSLKLAPDRTLTITHPNGTTLTSVPDRLTRRRQQRADPDDDPDNDPDNDPTSLTTTLTSHDHEYEPTEPDERPAPRVAGEP